MREESGTQTYEPEEYVGRPGRKLARLPDGQHEAIVLHHLQGLKLAEVASQMDRTEAAVAGLLFRGLKTLQTDSKDEL